FYVELLQLVDRQVDAAAPRVVADVADDIGELKRQAQLGGIFERARVGVAEYPRGQFADHAGGVPTVVAQRRPVQIARLVQVHFHAGDSGLHAGAFNRATGQVRRKRAHHGVFGLAREQVVDLRAPPCQLDARHRRVGTFVHHVVYLAAERVQRGNGAPALGRQEQERIIKTRTALGGLFLAVLVRRHKLAGIPSNRYRIGRAAARIISTATT